MTPGEMADRLELSATPNAGGTAAGQRAFSLAAAAMLREAERIMRQAGVELASEGLGVNGLNEWLGVPENIVLFADYRQWMLGTP